MNDVYQILNKIVDGEPVRAIDNKDAYSYPAAYHFGAFERNDLVTLDASILGEKFCGRYCDVAECFRSFSRSLENSGRKKKTKITIEAKQPTDVQVKLYPFVRKPQYMEFTMQNRSKQPITAGMLLHEAVNDFNGPQPDICSWEFSERYVVAPGETKTMRYSFHANSLRCLNPSSKAKNPAYCTSVVCGILLTGIKPNMEYDLLFSDDLLYFGYASGVEAEVVSNLSEWSAGKEVSLEIGTLQTVGERQVDVEMRKHDRVMWRLRLNDEQKSILDQDKLTLKITPPWYLSDGCYSVGLAVDGYRVRGGEWSVRLKNEGEYTLPKAERREYHGLPTLFVNDQPLPFTTYSAPVYQPGSFKQFGKAGTSVVSIELPVGAHLSKRYEDTLVAPGVYDFSSIDEMVAIAMEAAPEAYLLLRCYPTMPWFWFQENEDQRALIKTDKGNIAAWEENGEPAASLASEKWLSAQEKTIHDFIAYIKTQPWSSRVIGFHITGGATCEWFSWGSNYDGLIGSDFSRINQETFKSWMKKHGVYDGSDDPVPELEARLGRHSDILPDTKEAVSAAMYSWYYSDLLFQTMERLAKAVKQASDNRLIVGTFYGYVLQLSGESRQAISYSLAALSKVLASPYIDYIGGVPLHTYRNLDGYDSFVSTIDSVIASGKLYYNENDLFSWLHPIHWNVPYDKDDPRGGAISMHRRVMANDAVHGALLGWFGLADSWHNDEKLLEDFSLQMKAYKESYQFDRTPVSEAALVTDDTSFTWVSAYTTMPFHNNVELMYEAAKTGRPVSVWIMEHLDRLPDRIRFVMVPFAFASKPKNIEKLRRLIEQGARTILVVGAPGYINPETGKRDMAAVRELLNLSIRENPALGRWDQLYDDTGKCVCPARYMPCPRFELEEEGFLHYAEGFYAAAKRPLANGGQLIWCGTAPADRKLLGQWMAEAGVHQYAPEGFTVQAARELLSVTAGTAGPRNVNLQFPFEAEICDLMDGFSGCGKQIRCEFAPGQTRLFSVKKRD